MKALALAVLLSSLLLPLAGRAQGSLVDLSIYDRTEGKRLPVYWHHGRAYVVGKPGNEYQVVVRNRLREDSLAVVSVDGLNVVTGELADARQSGYVLGPGRSYEILGWRKSLAQTAAFYFTALPDSYAARTGRPENVGVIGVAVFTERMPAWREREQVANDAAKDATPPPAPSAAAPAAEMQRSERAAGAAGAAAPSASMAQAKPESRAKADTFAPAERLGTGHGAREYAHVDETTFERASRAPAETLAVWYDSYANLVAQGIIARPVARSEPQPFPGGFVPDPPPRR